MTNREALLRLSVNRYDNLAVASLRDNNSEIIRATVIRYFGTEPVASNLEFALAQRLASYARLYEPSEDADAWLTRRANTECDRLRNESIRDKANRV
jgi:hypothetical protein